MAADDPVLHMPKHTGDNLAAAALAAAAFFRDILHEEPF
jgi:hypothetical protein